MIDLGTNSESATSSAKHAAGQTILSRGEYTRDVAGDRSGPSQKIAAGTKVGKLPPQRNPRLLKHFLRVLPDRQHGMYAGRQRPLMPGQKFQEFRVPFGMIRFRAHEVFHIGRIPGDLKT